MEESPGPGERLPALPDKIEAGREDMRCWQASAEAPHPPGATSKGDYATLGPVGRAVRAVPDQ